MARSSNELTLILKRASSHVHRTRKFARYFQKMTQFFTNEAVSLEKEIGAVSEPTKVELIDDTYELQKCADWIKSNNFQKVCLQFPDHLLPDSAEVALRLENILGQNVYILADTAYESCCVDFVAAAHISADSVIHFGPVCFSKSSAQIPFLYIYEKHPLDLESLGKCVESSILSDNFVILLDTPFVYLTDEVRNKFPSNTIKTIDSHDLNIRNEDVLFIGGNNQHRKLPNLKFSYKPKSLHYFNQNNIVNYENETIIRRRYFLIEKIKDSNTVGIVIGTLGVKNYLQAIERLKKLLTLHKKKYYIISVGKPTVAKLANFPEIDIYIVVTCALNEIYESRDFYKPIVTLYDAEMALNSNGAQLDFSYDYSDVIGRPIGDVGETSDVSLLTGRIRGVSNVATGDELVAKGAGTVALNTNHGAGFLAARSWRGLDQDLGRGEIQMAEEGRRGIAQQYAGET